jgi:hypothetical protein
MTAIDLITRAFRTAGVYGSGETPSADDAADALAVLNEMLDSWSVARLYVYQLITDSLPATLGKSVYTLGTSGDFNTTRPTQITSVIYTAGSIDYTVDPITDNDFASIPYKAAAGIPCAYNYEPSLPLASLSLYPVPGVAGTIKVQSPKQLTQFAALNTDVQFPPGYQTAIRLSLAVELCSEFNMPVPAVLGMRATKAVAKIRRMNVRVPTLAIDLGRSTSRNILTGFR